MIPHRLSRLPVPGALVLLAACGSTGSSPSEGLGAGDEAAAPAAGSSGTGSSGSSSGSVASGSGGSGSSSGSSSGGSGSGADAGTQSEAGARSDGGSVWQPTNASPIHFHWFIGASPTFATSDILSGQNGQVVYDIDGANSTAADVTAIHQAGAIAVCYVDVGTLEQGRPDYSQFPSSMIGPVVQGWPSENWLLVTAANQSTILPLMQARFTTWCKDKGFDAIEPDNLDAWTNISNVTEADNVTYDLAIGQLAHSMSMSIGLKNVMTDVSTSQYASFLAAFDWALNEQCYEYSECGVYSAAGSFLPAGKAVFDVEYNVAPTCSQANGAHMNAQETDLDLVGPGESGYMYTPCVPDSQATW